MLLVLELLPADVDTDRCWLPDCKSCNTSSNTAACTQIHRRLSAVTRGVCELCGTDGGSAAAGAAGADDDDDDDDGADDDDDDDSLSGVHINWTGPIAPSGYMCG